jgi:carbon storage regulator
MLVLSRRLHEKILFPGFNTAVHVVSIESGSVRIGIEAPADVKVLREEIATGKPRRGSRQKSGNHRSLEPDYGGLSSSFNKCTSSTGSAGLAKCMSKPASRQC